MTKIEAIKNAYGEYWDVVKDNLTDSNWFKSKEVLGDFANTHIRMKMPNIEWECMNNYHSTYCYYFRPKSLSGIETNNNWQKIESEADLPTEANQYWSVTEKDNEPRLRWCNKFFNEYEDCGKVTHYQPIIKPQPPIY